MNDLLLERHELQAFAAEAALVSIVLQQPQRLGEVLGATDLDDWRCPQLVQLMRHLAVFVQGFGADAFGFVSFAMHLEDQRPACVRRSTLAELLEFAGGMEPVQPFADGIRRAVAQKAVRESLDLLVDAAADGAELEEHIQSLQRAGQLRSRNDLPSMVDVADRELDVMQTQWDGGGGVMWPTGLMELDEALSGGLRPGRVVVIGGRPGMGKTALGLQLADAAALAGARVHVYSGEMTRGELSRRAMSLWSDADAGHLQRPDRMPQGTMDRLAEDVGTMKASGYRMLIDDRGGKTWGEVVAGIMRSAFRLGGLDLVLVDYLQLLRVPPGETEYTAYTAASKAAKALSKDLDCVVVLLCQLNRGQAARKSKEPLVTDLRATGQIEQDADLILFPYRPHEDDEMKPPSEAVVLVAKNRQGRQGRVPLRWVGHLTRFEDIDVFGGEG